jgi:hypothetical protein
MQLMSGNSDILMPQTNYKGPTSPRSKTKKTREKQVFLTPFSSSSLQPSSSFGGTPDLSSSLQNLHENFLNQANQSI